MEGVKYGLNGVRSLVSFVCGRERECFSLEIVG